MNNELSEKIQEVYKLNSKQNIITIAIEELGELIQVLCKFKRYLDYDKTLRKSLFEIDEQIREELADVYLLMEQIKIMIGIDTYYIENIISEKIDRTFKKVGVSINE